MASGYIAGGAIAGILIAFILGVPKMKPINDSIEAMSKANPFSPGLRRTFSLSFLLLSSLRSCI